jgi:hypothetical protein
MQTVIIDILNQKVVKLILDLEMLQLIRVRRDKIEPTDKINWAARYKGAMHKQPVADIDKQLNTLRQDWE